MKAAIFDMDGTMLDSMNEWDNIGINHLKSMGVDPPLDLGLLMHGMSVEDSAEFFMTRFGLWETKEELLGQWDEQIGIMYEKRVGLKPFVKENLVKLKKMGVRMCVATATPKRHTVAILKKLELLDFFEFILCEDEVGSGKNQPDIYIKAALNFDIAPDNIIVFEDALYAIKSAKAAGFTVCGVYDESYSSEIDDIKSISDYFIYDFSEVLKFF